jgi:hypothetical protein
MILLHNMAQDLHHTGSSPHLEVVNQPTVSGSGNNDLPENNTRNEIDSSSSRTLSNYFLSTPLEKILAFIVHVVLLLENVLIKSVQLLYRPNLVIVL